MNTKKIIALCLTILIVVSLVGVKVSAKRKVYKSALAGDFIIQSTHFYSQEVGDNIKLEPVPIITLKNNNLLITKLEEVTDDKGTYLRPMTDDGKPVYIKPSEEGYYENMKKIISSFLASEIKTDARISNLSISMKLKNESGRGLHSTIRRLYYDREVRLYELSSGGGYVDPDHPLFQLSPGSLIIYDSNLNYNVYDVKTGDFKLVESGCLNPDVLRDNDTLDYSHPELRWLLEEMDIPYSYGYLQLFDGEKKSVIDGKDSGNIGMNYAVIDGQPTFDNCYTLTSYISNVGFTPSEDNMTYYFYRLFKRPRTPENFYLILETEKNNIMAKVKTADMEEEFELSFEPYPVKDDSSRYVYPLLDILDALGIQYHYPRCDGSILISLNRTR